MAPPIRDLRTRFWLKVRKTKGCWIWTAGVSGSGYGAICPGPLDGNVGAHRVSWMLHYGEIPEGMFVLHRCDEKLCVRPSHLFLGTQADNIADSISKGRKPLRPNAKLTERDVRWIRKARAAGVLTETEAARRFGVSRITIGRATLGITWVSV